MAKLTLHIGATGDDPVRLLNEDGVDLIEHLALSAVRVDVLPGQYVGVTLTMPVDAVVAEVDSRAVNLPLAAESQGVVAHAVMPSLNLDGIADAKVT